MLAGGHLVEECYNGDPDDCWKECSFGEDLEDCRYLGTYYDEPHCDTWCAPNSGILTDDGCKHTNISDE